MLDYPPNWLWFLVCFSDPIDTSSYIFHQPPLDRTSYVKLTFDQWIFSSVSHLTILFGLSTLSTSYSNQDLSPLDLSTLLQLITYSYFTCHTSFQLLLYLVGYQLNLSLTTCLSLTYTSTLSVESISPISPLMDLLLPYLLSFSIVWCSYYIFLLVNQLLIHIFIHKNKTYIQNNTQHLYLYSFYYTSTVI